MKDRLFILLAILTISFGWIGNIVSIDKTSLSYTDYVKSFLDSISLFALTFPKHLNIYTMFASFMAIATVGFGLLQLYLSFANRKLKTTRMQKKKFTLVCGLGNNNRYFLNTAKEKNIIIVEQDKNNPYIKEYEMLGYAAKIDDCLRKDFFDKNNLDTTHMEQMIVSLGDDRKNIQVAANFTKKIDTKESKRLFLHIEDRKIRLLFEKLIAESAYKEKSIETIPYSYYEQSIKLLFLEHTILGDMTEIANGNDEFNIVIIGDGELAKELVFQVCLLSHLPNENRLHLYCIDKNAKRFVKKLEEEYRYISKIPTIDIHPLELDYDTPEFAKDGVFYKRNLTNVFIAYDKSEINLDIAIDLHDKTYLEQAVKQELKTKVFFAVYDQMEISSQINSNKKEFKQFFAFGNASNVLSYENIINEKFDKIAKLIHYGYEGEFKPDNLYQEKEDWVKIDKEWHKTTTAHDRVSNKSQALHIDVKLASLGLKKRANDTIDTKELLKNNKEILSKRLQDEMPSDEEIQKYAKKTAQFYKDNSLKCDFFPREFRTTFEKIVRSEHNRWNAYHYMLGWEYIKKAKAEKEIKKHNCLIPFCEFQDESIKFTYIYDIYSLAYIPNYLANTGYEIVEIEK